MANDFFRFRQFTVNQGRAAFKVGTDSVLLGALANLPAEGRILDVGTGTGLLALMAAQRTKSSIVAIEPHHDSFEQARFNTRSSPWAERITLKEMTFQDFAREEHERFNCIISNPPYFRNSLKNEDRSKSFTRHDDSLPAKELLSGSVKLLDETGSLQVILPYTEGTLFIAEAAGFGLYCNRIIKIKGTPAGNVKRLILGFHKTRSNMHESFLIIERGTRQDYTNEYREATKDFYLDLQAGD
ncbi:MAG: methyltransferase [Bacteroidales bacterium]